MSTERKMVVTHKMMSHQNQKFCPNCGGCEERYLSPATAARIFDLTEQAVRSMIKRRDIPSYRLGTRRILKYSELETLLVRYPSKADMSLEL